MLGQLIQFYHVMPGYFRFGHVYSGNIR